MIVNELMELRVSQKIVADDGSVAPLRLRGVLRLQPFDVNYFLLPPITQTPRMINRKAFSGG